MKTQLVKNQNYPKQMKPDACAFLDILRHELPKDIVFLMAFGSQVYGRPKPTSDLDLLFVVEKDLLKNNLYLEKFANKHGMDVDIVIDTIQHVKHLCNSHGTAQFDAVRKGFVIYNRIGNYKKIFDVKTLNCTTQANFWIEMAKKDMDSATKEFNNKYYPYCCLDAMMSIRNSIKAQLLLSGIKFPKTRDIHILYQLLPKQKQKKYDLQRVKNWLEYFNKKSDEKLTRVEAVYALKKAKRIYNDIFN